MKPKTIMEVSKIDKEDFTTKLSGDGLDTRKTSKSVINIRENANCDLSLFL